MKSNHHLGLLVSVMVLSACSIGSNPPNEDKIKADLIGGTACSWKFNTIKEFRKLEIVDQVISTEIIEFDLKLEMVRGEDDRMMDARAIYKKWDGGWILSMFDESSCTSTEQIAREIANEKRRQAKEKKQIAEEQRIKEEKRIEDKKYRDRYTDHGDSTVTDKQTKLMWKKCAEGLEGSNCTLGKLIELKWQEAINYGENAEFAGHSDWRLPSRDELEALAKQNLRPNIKFITYFPYTKEQKTWSATPHTKYKRSAYSVRFKDGQSYYSSREKNSYLRLVRSSVQ